MEPAAKQGPETKAAQAPWANRNDWRTKNLQAFTMPDFSKKAQQIRMGPGLHVSW
jgi:hypothetical protein